VPTSTNHCHGVNKNLTTAPTPTNILSSVDHIVVLMLENRSFDHMLGFLYTAEGNVSPSGASFDGLTGKESNPDQNGNPVLVSQATSSRPNLYFLPGADPGEGYAATNSQLFGAAGPSAQPTNAGFVTNYSSTLAWESRDPSWSVLPGTAADEIMVMFTPETLPVLSALAKGFAVCDQWFSSVPTETLPNRAFGCAATSQGHMDDKAKTFTSPSIFGLLSNKGTSWTIYGYDSPPLTRQLFSEITEADETHFGLFTDFQSAAAQGALAAFSFLEPSWESTGNSQHPNYDVALGEQLLHDVYYALRGGPAWASTLLVVTYDEHGGCYDHVPPPGGAVRPDATLGEYGFDFTRFGVRVPALLVSPLIEPGTIFRAPEGGAPFDHTSVLRTVELRWGLPSLTARDAAAPDICAALTLAAPRADDPLAGVTVPVSGQAGPSAGLPSHLVKVHAELVSHLVVPGTAEEMPNLRTSADYTAYIRSRTAAWQQARARGAGGYRSQA
jgi:phospholipase C